METPSSAILSCTKCKQEFVTVAELDAHIVAAHPIYVQTTFTPQDVRIIGLYTVLGKLTAEAVAGDGTNTLRNAMLTSLTLGRLLVYPHETRMTTLRKLHAVAEANLEEL